MNTDESAETAENGRRPDGTFGPGNQFASHQKRRQHVSALRDAALQRLTPNAVEGLVDVLLQKAKSGDLPAIRCLLGLMGRFKENIMFSTLQDLPQPARVSPRPAKDPDKWKDDILAGGGERAEKLRAWLEKHQQPRELDTAG